MHEKTLSVGYSIGRLSIDIDGNTIDIQNPQPKSSYYIGYTSQRGKFAIYLRIDKVIKGLNGSSDTGIINVTINDYVSSEKLKEYRLSLSNEWHKFDELV